MRNLIDAYTIRARLVPAIIAGAPAFAFAAIFVSWGGLGVPHLIATFALTVLFSVFADVARRGGKAIEPDLIAKIGGLPSTTMLRHRDATFDPSTKAKMQAFISGKLNEPCPTPEQEERDPAAADLFYARGGTWLRENTRDTKKFSGLFSENINYGFRRNLLGLRAPGFLLNAAIVAICASIFWYRFPVDLSNSFNQKLLAVIVIAILHAAYLATFVTERGVFDAARLYARQLLLASLSGALNKAEPAPAPKSRAKKVTQ